MTDIILTHGFYLEEDEIEQKIMKPYPPLGLLYIASALKEKKIPVTLFDSTFHSRKAFREELQRHTPSWVGIYTTHMTREACVWMAREAGKFGWKVVFGGPDSANYPEEYLCNGGDVVVIGEGEETVYLLLGISKNNWYEKALKVPGIIFKDPAGNVIRTGPRNQLDIHHIPWPDRESVDFHQYFRSWKKAHGTTSINLVGSRGCSYHCKWCSHSVFGHTFRQRHAEDVADEIEYLREKYNPGQLWFSDDVFTRDHEWIHRLSREIVRRKIVIPFETISRADRMLSESMIEALAAMGCYQVWIGSESGSGKILKAMNRGVTPEQIVQAVRLCKKYGIKTGIFLMWGYPGETEDDIEATMEHIVKADPDLFFTTIIYPIKNTAFYYGVEDRLIVPDDWVKSTDKDLLIKGMPSKEYFKAVNEWVKKSVKARKIVPEDPVSAAALHKEAALARKKLADILRGLQ